VGARGGGWGVSKLDRGKKVCCTKKTQKMEKKKNGNKWVTYKWGTEELGVEMPEG